jgi:hypothetical protein
MREREKRNKMFFQKSKSSLSQTYWRFCSNHKRGNKKETLSLNAGGTGGVLSKFLRKPKIRPNKNHFWT